MRARCAPFALRALTLLLPALGTQGAVAAEAPRFRLSGTAVLVADEPPQQDDRVRLHAQLVSTVQDAREPMPVANSRFALTAMLSATAVACSADTIFRDSFDGTGL